MIGIIATIIAARKRHYTFAWVIGIWTGIAIILALCGMIGIAIGPGALFLFIAIGMKKIPEESNSNTASQTPVGYNMQGSVSTPNQASMPTATSFEPSVAHDDEIVIMERSSPAPAVIRFCRYCGQELELGAKFCRHCGARIE